MAQSQVQTALFTKLNGGLNVSMAPEFVQQDPQGPLQSPDCQNCDFWETGSVAKRYGKVSKVPTFGSTTSQSQLTISGSQFNVTNSASETVVFCQKFVAAASKNLTQIIFQTNLVYTVAGSSALSVQIKNDNGGQPTGTVLATQSCSLPTSGVQTSVTASFSSPPALSSGTTYWFCVSCQLASSNTSAILYSNRLTGTTGDCVYTINNFVSFNTLTTTDAYYQITLASLSSACQGGYNYLKGSGLSQAIMIAGGGTLYWDNAGTWTSLTAGLQSGQNNLWDFATFKGLLFSTDYAGNIPRVWDQSSTGTMQLGYRMSAGYGAAPAAVGHAGGTLSATGKYNFMFVTQLISGGFRASIVTGIVPGTSNGEVIISSLACNSSSSGSQFGFDIAAAATYVFMTKDLTVATNDSFYYLVPTANMGSVANPMPNSTTTITITAPVAGTENTLLTQFNLDQSYFTSQTDAPKAKFFKVWTGFLSIAGDPSNPSRVWFSEQYAPQNWGTGPITDGLHGDYLDINPDDGDQITGLSLVNNNLVVFKNHSIYQVTYTGNAQVPFYVQKVSSEIGTFSHWSVRTFSHSFYGNTLAFLSENGVGLCYGTFATLMPEGKNVSAYFDSNNSFSFNLAGMKVSQSGQDYTTQKIWWLVSSNGSSNRDTMLVLDYRNMAFNIWQGIADNILFEVTDANNFRQLWSGDYSGNTYQYQNSADDAGNSISWYWKTPWITLGNKQFVKYVRQLIVSGDIQTAAGATLNVDVYLDFSSTPAASLTLDMTQSSFGSGAYLSLNQRCRAIQLKFSNNQLDVPVRIDAFTLTFAQEEIEG